MTFLFMPLFKIYCTFLLFCSRASASTGGRSLLGRIAHMLGDSINPMQDVNFASELLNSTQTATKPCKECCVDSPDINYSDVSGLTNIDSTDLYSTRALNRRFRNERRNDEGTATLVGNGGGTATLVGKSHRPCSVAIYIPRPIYPSPVEIYRADSGDSSLSADDMHFLIQARFWAVPTYSLSKCDAPGWAYQTSKVVTKPQIGPVGTTDTTITNGWQIGGTSAKTLNIDHVYEIGVLDEFFGWRTLPNTFGCPNIQKLFNQPSTIIGSSGTLLNFIFSHIASRDQPDFIGMDAALNKIKGSLWNRNLDGFATYLPDPTSLKKRLGQVALVMSNANEKQAIHLWQNTNARIYLAMQKLDKAIRDGLRCGSPQAKARWQDVSGRDLSPTWAAGYSAYITHKISSQNLMIKSAMYDLSNKIPTNPAQATAKPQAGAYIGNARWMADFNKKYPIAKMTFPPATDWPVLNSKRGLNGVDDEDGDACPLDAMSPTATKTGVSATGNISITPAPNASPLNLSSAAPITNDRLPLAN